MSDGRALELADRAWRAAEADEADAVVQVEESGFARFAGSEVHQPTLISDESITLRVVRRAQATRTLLAGFPSTDSAGAAVSAASIRSVDACWASVCTMPASSARTSGEVAAGMAPT